MGSDLTNEGSLREYKARIQRVIDHVENNTRGRLTPGVLAEVSGFSPYHFENIFHAFVGETPDDFVNRIKLEKAASRLITYPSEQIAEVASVSGFPSASVFAKAFREHFGCSAREWRSGNLDSLLKDNGRKGELRRGETVSPTSNRGGATSMAGEIVETRTAEIRIMPPFHAAYFTGVNGRRGNIGRLFLAIRRWADSNDLLTSATKMIWISLDDPKLIPSQKRRYYACLTVPAEMQPGPDISFADLPASRSAVLRFEGDIDGIEEAYDWVFGKFIPENGCQPDDRPSYEIYYGGFDNRDERPSVDICVPVVAMET